MEIGKKKLFKLNQLCCSKTEGAELFESVKINFSGKFFFVSFENCNENLRRYSLLCRESNFVSSDTNIRPVVQKLNEITNFPRVSLFFFLNKSFCEVQEVSSHLFLILYRRAKFYRYQCNNEYFYLWIPQPYLLCHTYTFGRSLKFVKYSTHVQALLNELKRILEYVNVFEGSPFL